jgi:(p)ppGpp synthase/HD superfamily hydrolase
MTDLITRAQAFAHAAHDAVKQVRKYDGTPYWTHTDAVAGIVAAYGGTETEIAAAHLHDTLEDTETTFGQLEREFGTEIALIVHELTDLYTPQNYPDLNRMERKVLEAARLATIGKSAKKIKLADLYNNTNSIVQHDPGFAVTYIKEKARVLPNLVDGDPDLFKYVRAQLLCCVDELKIVLDKPV